jgi:hypothetical protein
MYVFTDYVFTPGAAYEGTITLTGVIDFDIIGPIYNVTRNIPLYLPDNHEVGVTYQIVNGNTVLTLEQNTADFCESTDDLQILLYEDSSQTPVVIEGFGGSTGDAFGRLRTSNPYTMFDSSYRYTDNGKWSTATATGGTATFNAAQGLMDLNVTGALGSSVARQTNKIFSYQPGKSLLVMSTFVLAPQQTGLRQRVGYYDASNGYYLSLDNNTLSFVERSAVSGSIVNIPVLQANWNVDPLNGTGPSGITLDPTKAQILFIDMEWLGVGTVRMGFVIDGQFIICHKFNHANLITSTYITTASLPLMYEIENTGNVGSASTLKQICSTVISEGGYQILGQQYSVATPITTPKTLANKGTYYPLVASRLRSTQLNAVAILSGASVIGGGNNETYRWVLVKNPTLTGGTWSTVNASAAVEYSLDITSFTGGEVVYSGFFTASNQSTSSIDISSTELFSFQYERNGLTGTASPYVLAVAGANDNQIAYGSLDWQEISR